MKYSFQASKNVTRHKLARTTAQAYVARLLMDTSEHADAFEEDELTPVERAIARDEVKRLGIELAQRYRCEL